MALVNPFYYPAAMLLGGVSLVVGIRFVNLSGLIMLPVSTGVTVGSALLLKGKEEQPLNTVDPVMEREIEAALTQAQLVASRAQILRQDAHNLLESSDNLSLLTTIEYACDRAQELPSRIQTLSQKLSRTDSVLSIEQLEGQLQEVRGRLAASSGISKQHLEKLKQSLARNLELAKQGENSQQAQIISLSTWIMDSAGVLQHLQNNIRNANLDDLDQVHQIENLSQELEDIQKNMDLMMS